MKPGWLVSQQRIGRHPAPARKVLVIVAVLVIAAGIWFVVRAGSDRPRPARVETSQSACPSPPQGYSPCDPIPTNTGFQTGDKG